MMIPIVVQHRHVHLSAVDQDALFGAGVRLTNDRETGQRGQMVYKETVAVVGPNGTIESVRIIGPTRETTQVELSSTDAFALGIDAPLRLSGDLSRAAACVLRGPIGEVKVTYGVIIPARHLHLNPKDAATLGLAHLAVVKVVLENTSVRLPHVSVRVHPTFSPELHLTADEAAEAWVHSGDLAVVE